MSDRDDDSQRNEQPTQKRLDDARRKGEVAIAADIRHAAMFAGMTLVVALLAAGIGKAVVPVATTLWGDAQNVSLDAVSGLPFARALLLAVAVILLPPVLLLFATAIGGGLAQGPFVISTERLRPKWSRLSPLGGLRRLFSANALADFLKTVAKASVVGIAGFSIFASDIGALTGTLVLDAAGLVGVAGRMTVKLLLAVTAAAAAIAVLDFLWQRFQFMKRMRMTRDEVRRETKDSEGDPHINARIRQVRIERSRHRMMTAVPGATVVITNPTHYAVALAYEHGDDNVPTVVAKGVDAVAARIRAIAGEHGIPLVENPALARTLHAHCDIGAAIPIEHYAAVAEVIGYVLRLKGRPGSIN